jgi:hypothetical protein
VLRIYFLIFLSAFPLVSMGQVTEGLWTYIVENGGATITGSTATGAVTLPSELGGYAVKKVGNGSPPIFGNQSTSVTSVYIPSSVTNIGDYAFSGCTSLTSTTIPNSVTSIGNYAFQGCSSLTSITIPNGVTSIGEGAFDGCTALTSINIGSSSPGLINPGGSIIINPIIPQETTEGEWTYIIENGGATITASTATGAVTIPSELGGYPVKKVGNQWPPIFGYPSTSVTSVVIPSSVTSIGSSAFTSCTGLTSITIGTSVTSIGESAFSGCTGLTSITIGTSVTSIGESAFANCTALASIVIPNSVTSIEGSAFYGCTSLASIVIPNSVTSIEGSAFSYCFSLTTITIPSSVTSIEGSAFYGCTSLASITIPSSVTSIGSSAFSGCSGLTSVTMPVSYIGQTTQIGISGQVASDYIINALANNDAFVTAVANKIKATSGNYGLATQSGVTGSISSVINEGKVAGVASVMASPNTWSLFTTSQIQNMAIGDLVLTREVNGNFVLNYDIEQSEDLANWTVYSANRQIVKLPADKAFVRIKAKQ